MQVMTQLAFKGQCREAFELYEKVLGGKISSAIGLQVTHPRRNLHDHKRHPKNQRPSFLLSFN